MADQQSSQAPVSYPASSTSTMGTRVVRDTATAVKQQGRRHMPKTSSRTHPTPKGR